MHVSMISQLCFKYICNCCLTVTLSDATKTIHKVSENFIFQEERYIFIYHKY